MSWDWLIDKEEAIYLGLFGLFCLSCWSIIFVMFWVLYGILSLLDFIRRKCEKFAERMIKHGRSENYSELDGQPKD